ncbi:hypothetical protein [Microbulbifer aggregans]|uniref:hypothetical protein n=1 Tax=Microbulbifer aggregans TaxID=1769779 RepID=UPI001CFEE543|nr:hypothetical protein [Microbulbifer aggregans]
MKKSPQNTTVFIEISLIYEDFVDSLRDTGATTKEKFLVLLFSPIMLPVAMLGVMLGIERAISCMLGIFVSFLCLAALAGYFFITYGPYLIQQLNTYVNG